MQWQLYKEVTAEDHPDDEANHATFDAAARRMFLGGEMENKLAADFRRFCRCAIQAALLGQDRRAWEDSFRMGINIIVYSMTH